MRIGISVISRAGQNIWENGLGQNVFFLAKLLQRLPFVQSVVLVDVGDQTALAPQVDVQAAGLTLIKQHDATDAVDLVIEMAGGLDPKWVSLMRARGKRVVFLCCGQPYAALIEPSVFQKSGNVPDGSGRDEIWLLPEYAVFVPMLRLMRRCPVHVVPYIWDASFLQARISEVKQLTGLTFGYQPKAVGSGLRIAIFEPNISVAKTSSISMLACDEAYRKDPSSVAMMHALNTLHMATHPTLLYLANSLDLVRQHKAVFVGRHDIVGYMAQHADAVVSHQWLNDQNYSYLDALYGNYPLIHNSPWLHNLAGAGYYYPGFDAAEGGRQILRAVANHDAMLDDYEARSRRVFDAVDPCNASNMQGYAERLQKVLVGSSTSTAGSAA